MLKRVSIQNFKSLKDVTLDLQKVNLLIGPNNSGKTNFLKALKLLADFADTQIELPAELYFKRDALAGITVSLLFETLEKFAFLGTRHTHVVLERNDRFKYEFLGSENNDKVIGTNNIFSVKSTTWRSLAGRTLIYKPDPNKLDKPSPVGRGDDLVAADASNLIAFFDRIRDEYPASFAQIKADLAKCVPEFTEINFQNVESTEELVKQFGDKTFKRIGLTDGRQKTIYWADELSEGTLYFIALLCIINQPNPPKLLLLEEPEKGIHPRRIYEVIQFILGLVDDKDIQVIMTTHSPVVVDMFKDMPESVFIFDKDEEGATHVKNLQKDIIEPETAESEKLGFDPPRYLDGLGDAWTIGFLGGVPR